MRALRCFTANAPKPRSSTRPPRASALLIWSNIVVTSQWRGYRPPPEPPGPAPGAWGEPTPMLSAVAQAALEGDLAGKVQALASDPKDGLAAALARLGRAFMARDS